MDSEDKELIEQLCEERARALAEWRRLRAQAQRMTQMAADKWHEAQRMSPAQLAQKFEIPHAQAKAAAQRVEDRMKREKRL